MVAQSRSVHTTDPAIGDYDQMKQHSDDAFDVEKAEAHEDFDDSNPQSGTSGVNVQQAQAEFVQLSRQLSGLSQR